MSSLSFQLPFSVEVFFTESVDLDTKTSELLKILGSSSCIKAELLETYYDSYSVVICLACKTPLNKKFTEYDYETRNWFEAVGNLGEIKYYSIESLRELTAF